MRKKSPPKAHEITTVYNLNNVENSFMGEYIVIAATTSKAISLIPLKPGERVIRAKELSHQVFVEGKK